MSSNAVVLHRILRSIGRPASLHEFRTNKRQLHVETHDAHRGTPTASSSSRRCATPSQDSTSDDGVILDLLSSIQSNLEGSKTQEKKEPVAILSQKAGSLVGLLASRRSRIDESLAHSSLYHHLESPVRGLWQETDETFAQDFSSSESDDYDNDPLWLCDSEGLVIHETAQSRDSSQKKLSSPYTFSSKTLQVLPRWTEKSATRTKGLFRAHDAKLRSRNKLWLRRPSRSMNVFQKVRPLDRSTQEEPAYANEELHQLSEDMQQSEEMRRSEEMTRYGGRTRSEVTIRPEGLTRSEVTPSNKMHEFVEKKHYYVDEAAYEDSDKHELDHDFTLEGSSLVETSRDSMLETKADQVDQVIIDSPALANKSRSAEYAHGIKNPFRTTPKDLQSTSSPAAQLLENDADRAFRLDRDIGSTPLNAEQPSLSPVAQLTENESDTAYRLDLDIESTSSNVQQQQQQGQSITTSKTDVAIEDNLDDFSDEADFSKTIANADEAGSTSHLTEPQPGNPQHQISTTNDVLTESQEARQARIERITHFENALQISEADKMLRGGRAIKRKVQILNAFHDFESFPIEDEWLSSLDLLQSMTPKDITAHAKQLQELKIGQDLTFRWQVNPRAAIVEILQSTGSLIQMREPVSSTHNPHDQLYRAATLYGTLAENEAACRLIIHKQFFAITHQFSVESSASLSQVFHPARLTVTSSTTPEAKDLQIRPRTIASFSRPKPVHTESLSVLLKASNNGLILPTQQLNAAVDDLRTPRSVSEQRSISTQFGEQYDHVVAKALGQLLTNPKNIAVATSVTLQNAFSFLANKVQFPLIRQILAAYDETIADRNPDEYTAVDAKVFNVLLQAAVTHTDIHTLRYLLLAMHERKIQADAATWKIFFLMTQKLRPGRKDYIMKHMRDTGMLENMAVRLEMLPHYVRLELEQELVKTTELPEDFMAQFVERVTEEASVQRWMTSECAEAMVEVLLPQRRWKEAFAILPIMAKHGRKPRLSLLHHFLDAVNKPGAIDIHRAIETLQHFNDLDESFFTPRSESTNSYQGDAIRLTAITYTKLFQMAQRSHSWNLTRVIWQHACCSGNVTRDMRQLVKHSLSLRRSLTWTRFFAMTENPFWHCSWALFVLGVNVPPLDIGRQASAKLYFSEQLRRGAQYLRNDLAAFGRYTPVDCLPRAAAEAFARDQQWRRSTGRQQSEWCPDGIPRSTSGEPVDEHKRRKGDMPQAMSRRKSFPFFNIFDVGKQARAIPMVSCSSTSKEVVI